MYLTADAIRHASTHLSRVHPFFGLTYLVCKKGGLPIGKTIPFPINRVEKDFLTEHYKIDPHSSYYFQPFKTSRRKVRWLAPKYASSGSQSTRTRGEYAHPFIHEKNTDQWGWKTAYVDVLAERLREERVYSVPAFWLAVWLYREREWPVGTRPAGLIDHLFREFRISPEEQKRLFDTGIPSEAADALSGDRPCTGPEVIVALGLAAAPDAEPGTGGTLRYLKTCGIGPVRCLEYEPGDRLSIITGDNGLGKSFLLECVWWSLTGQWAGSLAFPRWDAEDREPAITFELVRPGAGPERKTIRFDWEHQVWGFPKGRPTIPGLIVYARVDGSFAVWDPMRRFRSDVPVLSEPRILLFQRDEVLDGVPGRIEGLLRDWVNWQNHPNPERFATFRQVLTRLSPPEADPLTPGEPVRIPGDAREIPVLQHTHGPVPFTHESAGVRRIVTLAYLLVWAWTEHRIAASLARKQPESRIVVLIDEMEAHLHPQWQRVILPAVLDVASILSNEIRPQVMVATHSPLVLLSVESMFSEESDRLYHLRLAEGGEVAFDEARFTRLGRVDEWLTSDLFELKQARSREAEKIVEDAKAMLRQKHPQQGDLRRLTETLRKVLTADDIFWRRWMHYTSQHGVDL